MTLPAAAQAKYQIRFDWGVEGAAAVCSDADVVVWVDVLAPPEAGLNDPLPGVAPEALLLAGGLTNATAVAQRILDEQVRLGRRALVSIVAAGEPAERSGSRFAVEDLLGAGAVVDALAGVGIDYSSPEAAAACAAFSGLRGAVAHLLTASVSGQQRIASGLAPAEVAPFGRLGSVSAVTVLRAGPDSE
ncbi:2-phosphosulfolactate phosphatase [Leifsonia poae]|uniref:2-phosphosulfolactate phosphatase n=1 Tax=Leifsonia poae TaxID=110933 RepID=UPI001CBB90D7|nr:2-phosphosulfolactate phosphatase [Leifsonia poae]